MRYILNSAIIPNPGTYEYEIITLEQAKEWLAGGDYTSAIGYKETADVLTSLTDFPISVNRTMVRMEVGDEALVFKLSVRLDDPKLKGGVGHDFILQNSEIGLLRRIK